MCNGCINRDGSWPAHNHRIYCPSTENDFKHNSVQCAIDKHFYDMTTSDTADALHRLPVVSLDAVNAIDLAPSATSLLFSLRECLETLGDAVSIIYLTSRILTQGDGMAYAAEEAEMISAPLQSNRSFRFYMREMGCFHRDPDRRCKFPGNVLETVLGAAWQIDHNEDELIRWTEEFYSRDLLDKAVCAWRDTLADGTPSSSPSTNQMNSKKRRRSTIVGPTESEAHSCVAHNGSPVNSKRRRVLSSIDCPPFQHSTDTFIFGKSAGHTSKTAYTFSAPLVDQNSSTLPGRPARRHGTSLIDRLSSPHHLLR